MNSQTYQLVNNELGHGLQKLMFQFFCEKQLKEGWDVTIPPEERVAVAAPRSMNNTGNWGVHWHESHPNAEWIRQNAQRKVAVFVLDTGAGFTNAGLDQAWWREESRIFTGESGEGIDVQSHSTHVCGTIGGINSLRPISVGEELVKMGLLKIIPYKVLNDHGNGQFQWIVNGIDAAVERAIELQQEGWFCVINMSLGGNGQSDEIDAATTRAEKAGVFVSCAAGNNNGAINTPANGPNATAVAAHDAGGSRASFSCFGEDMETAAAGVGILSLLPNNREGIYSGTSMAAPHVSGLVAIIASCFPWMGLLDVERALFRYVHDIAPKGWDQYTGHGSFKLGQLIADPPQQGDDQPDEPDQPDNPDTPDEPEEPTFTSDVRTRFGSVEDPLRFRIRRQSENAFTWIKVTDLVVDIVAKGTEESAFDLAKKTVQDYFDLTAMVIPDDPAFGFETTTWWIAQFLEYQARQKSVALQAISIEGRDDAGRVALASGFDKAGFRKTRGGAILLNVGRDGRAVQA